MNTATCTPATCPAPLLVSIPDACAMLGVGRSTVYRLTASGALDLRKIAGASRITVASIRRLAGESTADAT